MTFKAVKDPDAVLDYAWVSAGTLGQLGRLVNTIVTTGGRTHVRTIEVSVKDT